MHADPVAKAAPPQTPAATAHHKLSSGEVQVYSSFLIPSALRSRIALLPHVKVGEGDFWGCFFLPFYMKREIASWKKICSLRFSRQKRACVRVCVRACVYMCACFKVKVNDYSHHIRSVAEHFAGKVYLWKSLIPCTLIYLLLQQTELYY